MEVIEAAKPAEIFTMMTEGKGTPFIPIPIVGTVAFGIVTSAYLLGLKPLSTTPNGAWDIPKDAVVQSNFGSQKILFYFRLAVFLHIVAVGASMLVRRGYIMLYFYTNWTWFLEAAFFGLAAWQSYKSLPSLPRGRGRPKKQGTVSSGGYAVVALFHVVLVAAIVVDLITWTLLWPMLSRSPDPKRVAFWREQFFCFTSLNTHGLNLVFMLVELALNKIPFEPYMLGWLGLYSSVYGLWAFSYYKITNRWMYPFMDASRPWAIYVYFGIYIGHWVFFGTLMVLFDLKRRFVAAVKGQSTPKSRTH